VIGGFVLLGLYLFTRFISIRSLPPFNDEFIYVQWAQEGFFDPALRLVSLQDGKQPLYIWLTSLMMNVIPSPLAAGRIVSVLSGVLTMGGIGVLSYQLYKSQIVSWVSALLYILFPHALLLDRFALYDSLLAALFLWNIIIMHMLLTAPSLGTALVLALTLGAALLVKSSAWFLFIILPLEALILTRLLRRKAHVLALLTVSILVALLYQSVQHLSPAAQYIAEKNTTFIYTWDEFRRLPILTHISQQLRLCTSWITSYLPIPLLLVAGSMWLTDRKHYRAHLLLTLSFMIPFIVVVFVGKTVYPRHLFFFSVPLLILAGSGVVRLWQTTSSFWFRLSVAFLCILPVAFTSFGILFDYKNATLPSIDRFQYIEGWPAGWGMKDIARFVEEHATKGKITILTEGIYGSMPTTAMRLYFRNYPQVHIRPIDDVTLTVPCEIDWSEGVYVILNKSQDIPTTWEAEEMVAVQKGNANSYVRLLKLKKPKTICGN